MAGAQTFRKRCKTSVSALVMDGYLVGAKAQLRRQPKPLVSAPAKTFGFGVANHYSPPSTLAKNDGYQSAGSKHCWRRVVIAIGIHVGGAIYRALYAPCTLMGAMNRAPTRCFFTPARGFEVLPSSKAYGMDIFQALGNNRFPRKDILAMEKGVWKKVEHLTPHEIMEALESHLDALDTLNTPAIGNYALASGLAPDEYHFLNLRAGVILQGRKCFERVLAGNFEPLDNLQGFTWVTWRLDETIKQYLNLNYLSKTNYSTPNLLDNVPFYSDARFIRQLQNPAYALKSISPTHEDLGSSHSYIKLFEEIDGGTSVECMHFPHLGAVRQGSVLRHKKMGICWVYSLTSRSSGQHVEAMMLFKDGELHNMLMKSADGKNGQLWSLCPESDWQE